MHAHPLRPRPALIQPAASSLQVGVPGGSTVNLKLTLTAPVTTDTPVALAVDDPAAVCPAAVTVPAGQSFARFSLVTGNPAVRRFLVISATLAGRTVRQTITEEPVPAALPPMVTGLFAADGKTPLTRAAAGTTAVVVGQHFGSVPGQVVLDPSGRAAVAYWTDTRIILAVPSPGVGPRLETVRVVMPSGTVLPVGPLTIDVPAAATGSGP